MQFPFMTEATPAEVTEEIEKFCEMLSPGQTPVFVPVRPQPEAEIDRCHTNVAHHVAEHGGTPQYGWILWQSQVLLNAVFHCNWINEDGDVIDITPKTDGEEEVLFLPDLSRKWEGRLIPSRRSARVDLPPVHRLVHTYDQMEGIRAKYPPDVAATVINCQLSSEWYSKEALLGKPAVAHRAIGSWWVVLCKPKKTWLKAPLKLLRVGGGCNRAAQRPARGRHDARGPLWPSARHICCGK